ncbi:hypothetical protein PVK06_012279 [Gossypium arboreum]|uniref:Uncharacterized protein n=1 Tax=Gossypium arboreum TaxID=29729 RepID=A0ABR0QB25_GOSAR|nr:hypothetical protein PVK06_012279 [Gossypium arboreum]
MARLPLIVQSERRKRIGLALTVWLQMCIVASWFGETVSRSFHNVLNVVIRLQDVLFKKADPITANSTDPIWKWFKVLE